MPALHDIPRADEFVALLRERLPVKTATHCISVAEYMHGFADIAGVASVPAVYAGLLHDLCKPMRPEELLDAAERFDIEVAPLQKDRPSLLHGPVAAEVARRELDVRDDAVYEAIYWHTTGKRDWNRVGLALYVGDFSEPGRTLPEAREARRMMEDDGFEATLRFVVEKKLDHVRRKYTVDPHSLEFEQWIFETAGT